MSASFTSSLCVGVNVARTVSKCVWTCHCNETAYEAEVGEVVWVDGRGRVDLQAVVALAGVLKQTVHGVQDFVGQQEEPFSAKWGETEASREHEDNRVYVVEEL